MGILDSQRQSHPIDETASDEPHELVEAQQAVTEVYVDALIKEYILALVEATRKHPDIYLGASPRGSLALYKPVAQTRRSRDREYVIPDDIKVMAEPTLAHRLIVSPSARIKNVDSRAVLNEILILCLYPGRTACEPNRTGIACVRSR